MDIKINIFSINEDSYGVYLLTRMDTNFRAWSSHYTDFQDGEICWRFYNFSTDNSYPTIHVDDDFRSYIKFKPEHLNGN